MNFVVLIHPAPDRISFEVRGPYRSFKRANEDAKAWDGIDGCKTSVEQLLTPDGHEKASHRKYIAAFGPCGK